MRHATNLPLLHYPQDVSYGSHTPPRVTALSLGRAHGIVEVQGTVVLAGFPAAVLKKVIEAVQLAAVRYQWVALLWYWQEQVMLWAVVRGQLLLQKGLQLAGAGVRGAREWLEGY